VLALLMAATSAAVLQPTLKLAGDADATTGAATINPTTDVLVPTATLAKVDNFICLPLQFAPLLPSEPYPAVTPGVNVAGARPGAEVVQDYLPEIETDQQWHHAR
jgi:hypothetical protein